MTVRSKLLAGFAGVIALLLLPALFAANRLAELQTLAVSGQSRHAAALLGLGQMRAALAELDRYTRSYVATGDESLRSSAAAELENLTREFAALASQSEPAPVEPLVPVVADLARLTGRIDALMRSDSLDAATAAFGALESVFADGALALARVTDSINLDAQEDLVRAEAVSASARRDTLLGTLFALLVGLGVATWVAATLTRPLESLGRAMARVADGRFDPPTDLPTDRRDEIGELSTSFRIMSHRLAELDRMKAEFLGVASHELKTPINTIHGYAELIREEYGEQAPDDYNRMVEGIGEQARTMARLVDRLMDLSRLETGAYRTQWEQVHVQDLITGLLRGFEVLARRHEVTLTHRILPDAPLTVEMDLDLVRDEVLGNLVQNAIRHTPRGGSIEIVVEGVAQGVVFTVTDSGPGVPDSERDRIFQKYYRGDASGGGTGLGLAIAREVVLLHGGFITLAEPEPERGARFKVVLPVHPPTGLPHQRLAGKHEEARRGRSKGGKRRGERGQRPRERADGSAGTRADASRASTSWALEDAPPPDDGPRSAADPSSPGEHTSEPANAALPTDAPSPESARAGGPPSSAPPHASPWSGETRRPGEAEVKTSR